MELVPKSIYDLVKEFEPKAIETLIRFLKESSDAAKEYLKTS